MKSFSLIIFSGLFFFFLNTGVALGVQESEDEKIFVRNYPLEPDSAFNNEYLTAFSMVYSSLDDLSSCDIKIKGKKLKTTMASRPTFFSMFRKKDKRKYVIVFNNDPGFDGVLLKDVPEQARIGLFAHELMHVRDYQGLKFGGLVKRGWQYMSKRGKKSLEYRIDSMTIAAGYGRELFFWSYYVLFDSKASDDYKTFKREVYCSPEDILNMLDDPAFSDVHEEDIN